MKNKRPSWYEWAYNLIEVVAQRSEDPNTKVGCIILDENNRIVSAGYNGLPKGLSEEDFTLGERPIKYQHVVHADMNAILFAERSRLVGSTMYVPFLPCCECSKAIIQSGISAVIYYNDYTFKDPMGGQNVGLRMMHEAGVKVFQFNLEHRVLYNTSAYGKE